MNIANKSINSFNKEINLKDSKYCLFEEFNKLFKNPNYYPSYFVNNNIIIENKDVSVSIIDCVSSNQFYSLQDCTKQITNISNSIDSLLSDLIGIITEYQFVITNL